MTQEEFQMLMELFKAMSGDAKTAFLAWLFAKYGIGNLTGILAVAIAAVGFVKIAGKLSSASNFEDALGTLLGYQYVTDSTRAKMLQQVAELLAEKERARPL